MFGVERSTVSKVLRHKEKYLFPNGDGPSSKPPAKLKIPDIERALANWARNRQKQGLPLSDTLLKDMLRFFAVSADEEVSKLLSSSSWLEKFKKKNNLGSPRYKSKPIRASKRFKLSLDMLNVLQTWLETHEENPYPSPDEKKFPADATGLTVKQLSTWFVNARTRQATPLEAWISSSSEDEAASPSDIHRALQNNDLGFSSPNSCYGSPVGSDFSVKSALSQCSDAVLSAPQKRGRKAPVKPLFMRNNSITSDLASTPPLPQSPSANYQCTFCHKTLTAKTWKRHEEVVHLPRSRWTCMACGPPVKVSTVLRGGMGPLSKCALCHASDPDANHFEHCHRVAECLRKPEDERTFNRKDHLKQHLKQFHSLDSIEGDITDKWEKKLDHSHHIWHCGFCGQKLCDWDARASHIAEHFRQGMKMCSWDSQRAVDDQQDQPSHCFVFEPDQKEHPMSTTEPVQTESSVGQEVRPLSPDDDLFFRRNQEQPVQSQHISLMDHLPASSGYPPLQPTSLVSNLTEDQSICISQSTSGNGYCSHGQPDRGECSIC